MRCLCSRSCCSRVPAGQIADRFSKTRVLQITKAFEIGVMVFGIFALIQHRIDMLLVVLFCLAAQANFFSPAKYGILPEITGEEQLARANGLVELSTFAAIVIGTGCRRSPVCRMERHAAIHGSHCCWALRSPDR